MSPQELKGVAEKRLWARTITSSYGPWKLKQRIALREPLALFEFARSGSAATETEKAPYESLATSLAKIRLTVATKNNRTSIATSSRTRSACFLNDYLTVPETQTLIFVAHPGPAETLH